MSIIEKLKRLFKKMTNRTPLIEATEEIPIGETEENSIEETEEIPPVFLAPKGTRENNSIETLAQKLVVPEDFSKENHVTFEKLEPKEEYELLKTVERKMAGKLGWTHNSEPTVTGKSNGESFVAIKRKNAGDDWRGQTICTENGYYEIKKAKSNPDRVIYREKLTLEDGTDTCFSVDMGKNVYSTASKNGISIRELARYATMHGQAYAFENYAQPSEEFLKEYAETTGLPIIMDSHNIMETKSRTGLDMRDLSMTMCSEGKCCSYPYIVSIEVSKETDNKARPEKKAIQYAYTSRDTYISGEKPYMIHMEGIDGRTGPSGMFRLKGDSYIDNSTFRKENGKYTYDEISYEEIMELAGKMPAKLSQRADLASKGKFSMPQDIAEIYYRALSIEAEKEEEPNKGKDISE